MSGAGAPAPPPGRPPLPGRAADAQAEARAAEKVAGSASATVPAAGQVGGRPGPPAPTGVVPLAPGALPAPEPAGAARAAAQLDAPRPAAPPAPGPFAPVPDVAARREAPAPDAAAAFPEPLQVALGLAVEGGRVLLLRRARDPYAGLWSLPGGKREPGEGLADTCRRELGEELGCAVEVGGLRLLVDQTLLDAAGGAAGRWLLAIFAFRVPGGGPLPPGVAWMPLAALDGEDLIPTDRRFIADAAGAGRFGTYRRAIARLDAGGRPQVLAYA